VCGGNSHSNAHFTTNQTNTVENHDDDGIKTGRENELADLSPSLEENIHSMMWK